MNVAHLAAVRLVAEKRYGEAMPHLIEACAAGSAQTESWTLIAFCLLCQGNTAKLLGLIEMRHRQNGDGMKLFSDCLLMALERSEHMAIRTIAASIPDSSALQISARYACGLIDAADGAIDRGIGHIIDAARFSTLLPPDIGSAPHIATIAVEGALLMPFDAVAALEQRSVESLLHDVGTVEAKAEFHDGGSVETTAPFIFFSACDERYLDRFGAVAVRAIDETEINAIYHLHIVDPTPALAAKITRLRTLCTSLDLRYSTETYLSDAEGYARAEYYACSRLVRLPEIFARYNRDVLMWDIDTEEVSNVEALVAAMEGHDLGYFHMKNTRLTLAAHLATVYFTDTEAMRRCADIIRNYVLAKLPLASYWLLDQAAVYCAAQFMAATKSLSLQDFSVTPGGKFLEYVDVASNAAEKQAMRKLAAPQTEPARAVAAA